MRCIYAERLCERALYPIESCHLIGQKFGVTMPVAIYYFPLLWTIALFPVNCCPVILISLLDCDRYIMHIKRQLYYNSMSMWLCGSQLIMSFYPIYLQNPNEYNSAFNQRSSIRIPLQSIFHCTWSKYIHPYSIWQEIQNTLIQSCLLKDQLLGYSRMALHSTKDCGRTMVGEWGT